MLKIAGYIIYVLGRNSYFFLVKLLSFFNNRADLLWRGQQNIIEKIKENESKTNQPKIWFHVSSLGEFEQGMPVIEGLKNVYPNHRIIVTFFSPSGYEQCKDSSVCDAIYYLPFENNKNAIALINILNPIMAFWVKYDFWFCYLSELKKRDIPVFLIAAKFRPTQIFFKSYGVFKRDLLSLFTIIFCQNKSSQTLLDSIGIHHHLLSGDNRYDRVSETAQQNRDIPFIKDFVGQAFCLIAGSSYEKEEELIAGALNEIKVPLKVIVAPHFVDEPRIQSIEKRFPGNTIRYSEIESNLSNNRKQVLIIDSIGLLSSLYNYANAAFIGGGFKENGLHNTLEAVAFGIPIAFGPKLKRFPEAQELVQEEIARIVMNQNAFNGWLKLINENPEIISGINHKSKNFVDLNKGATAFVINKINDIFPPTN